MLLHLRHFKHSVLLPPTFVLPHVIVRRPTSVDSVIISIVGASKRHDNHHVYHNHNHIVSVVMVHANAKRITDYRMPHFMVLVDHSSVVILSFIIILIIGIVYSHCIGVFIINLQSTIELMQSSTLCLQAIDCVPVISVPCLRRTQLTPSVTLRFSWKTSSFTAHFQSIMFKVLLNAFHHEWQRRWLQTFGCVAHLSGKVMPYFCSRLLCVNRSFIHLRRCSIIETWSVFRCWAINVRARTGSIVPIRANSSYGRFLLRFLLSWPWLKRIVE